MLAFFALLLACAGGDVELSDSGLDVDTVPADTGPSSSSGAVVYADTCADCHGDDGKLGSGGASDLTVKVPEQTDEQLTSVILNGYGDMGPTDVTRHQAADCVAYLRATFGGGV
jgi:mono/diheme cytochrome c family protein